MVDCKVGFRTGVILEGADAIVVTAKVQSTPILLHTEGREGKGCAFFWLAVPLGVQVGPVGYVIVILTPFRLNANLHGFKQ